MTSRSPQDEDSEFTLASDFEIGHFFRERIVPRAVLYFTGEAIEDDDNVGGLGTPARNLGPAPGHGWQKQVWEAASGQRTRGPVP